MERLGLSDVGAALSSSRFQFSPTTETLADLTARDISFINIFGVYLATKTDAMQDWSGTYCDVKSVSLADAAGTMSSPTVGILTFKASADGTCFGQEV